MSHSENILIMNFTLLSTGRRYKTKEYSQFSNDHSTLYKSIFISYCSLPLIIIHTDCLSQTRKLYITTQIELKNCHVALVLSEYSIQNLFFIDFDSIKCIARMLENIDCAF